MSIQESPSSACTASLRASPRLPPGPRGNWLRGSVGEFRRGILAFYTRCAREFGDVATFRFWTHRIYLLSHPDLVEEVLVTQNHNFRKNYLLRLLTPVLGQGLLMSEGDFWLRQRRLAQPVFHKSRVAAYGNVMVEHTERMLASWRDGESRDLHFEMMKLTLAIAAKTLFDVDVENEVMEVGQALDVIRVDFTRRLESLKPIPASWPTPANLRLRRAVRLLDGIIYRFIEQRRKAAVAVGSGLNERHHRSFNPEPTAMASSDLLSLLLNARDEDDGGQMTDKQLRDEALTLFLAGHETTAIAMSWTFYLLARHPQVEEKLLAELRDVLRGQPPTVDDWPRLRYTEMVVTEAMRLYPPAYVIGREAVNPCVIGGYPIPRGRTLLMSQWVIHRDPRFYENPDQFNPDRWADGLAKRLPKYAYFPFGGGPRVCIGNTFAMQEAVLLLATIAPRFGFTPVSAEPITPRPTVTLRPRGGVPVVVRKR